MTEIKIMDYLDAKEERLKALEVLKEKMLEITKEIKPMFEEIMKTVE